MKRQMVKRIKTKWMLIYNMYEASRSCKRIDLREPVKVVLLRKQTNPLYNPSIHSFIHSSINNPSYLSHQSHSSSLPSSVTFQLPVPIKNITVNQCIIDEGESTCVMSAHVWKWLGSTELVPSTITLRAYDGCPSQPEGLYQNVPIERVRLFSLMSRLFMLDWIRISSSSVVTCML